MINTISYTVKNFLFKPLRNKHFILEKIKSQPTAVGKDFVFILSFCASYQIVISIQKELQKKISSQIHLAYGDITIDKVTHNAVLAYNLTYEDIDEVIAIFLSNGLLVNRSRPVLTKNIDTRFYKQLLLDKCSSTHFSNTLFPYVHYFVSQDLDIVKSSEYWEYEDKLRALFREILPEKNVRMNSCVIKLNNKLINSIKLTFYYEDYERDLLIFSKNRHRFEHLQSFSG